MGRDTSKKTAKEANHNGPGVGGGIMRARTRVVVVMPLLDSWAETRHPRVNERGVTFLSLLLPALLPTFSYLLSLLLPALLVHWG